MKQWYVIQMLAGNEEKVKAEILRRIIEKDMSDSFGEILIPEAKNTGGYFSSEETNQQLFPGYMLIQLEASVEAFRLVTTVPRVVKFLGGECPAVLEEEEVQRIIAQIKGEIKVINKESHSLEVNQHVNITSGAFAGFVGFIQSIDESKQKTTVIVTIFGRQTPVEISFDQIKI